MNHSKENRKESCDSSKDTGQLLKERGMQIAIDNADFKIKEWSSVAYKFLVEYAKYNLTFMGEDVRYASQNNLPEPPSLRAWGMIISRAKKQGIIKHIGYSQVKNPSSHKANASIWESQILISEQIKLF